MVSDLFPSNVHTYNQYAWDFKKQGKNTEKGGLEALNLRNERFYVQLINRLGGRDIGNL